MKNISNNKPFLSIAIPTYNRAAELKNLLNCIIFQVQELEEKIEICISNNCSTDNTRKVVMNFAKKYPGIINYNENEKNLGFNRNMFLVMQMARGGFVWLLGDDESIIDNGIEKVVDFIKKECAENVALLFLTNSVYFIDKKNQKKITYADTVERGRSKVYKIDKKDIIGQSFPTAAFLSVLIYNNNFLKKILEEEAIIKKALEANDYIHTFLYRMIFLKYPDLEALRLNEVIVESDLHYYKYYIEDIFKLHYVIWTKLDDLLLSCKYVNNYYRKVLINDKRGTIKSIIIEMGRLRCFKSLDCLSFPGCIKMFFKEAPFRLALLFSAFFIFFSVTPSFILRNLYKIFVKIRLKKEWQKFWFATVIQNSEMSKGTRRLIC